MQEEIEHKTVNLAISTTKLSARTLLRGMQFLLRQYDKHASQGKQSMKRLVRQNRGVTNVEIQKTGIKDFDRYGCANLELTRKRLCGVAGLTVDPDQNKLVLDFCRKLEDETLADWYDQMFYFVRAEMEHYTMMQKMSRDIEEDEDWGPTIFDESEEEELIDDV